MIETPHFYAIIIGTEILNGRREDKHFEYIKNALLSRGHELYFSAIIKDSPALIHQVFTLVKNDPHAVMFSFGGIGSTPDDLTREIAAEVFTNKALIKHELFSKNIIERFGTDAYPHRIFMSYLPEGSELLHNPINNMSGFYLDTRYFFTPGFPEMAHPMIDEALGRFYPIAQHTKYRMTLVAQTSENTLIDIMHTINSDIELSSLPKLRDGVAQCEISVAGPDESSLRLAFETFTKALDQQGICYEILKIQNKSFNL